MVKNIAVFISGGGSNLQALIDEKDSINGDIKLVISNRQTAYGLERARKNGIASLYIDGSRKDYDKLVLEECLKRDIDLIVLAGYLKIVDASLLQVYKNKIINIHPSLLPSFGGSGWYGMEVHRGVYKSGVKLTGATVHFVDIGVDTGPIILQKSVDIYSDEGPEDIAKKVLKVEHTILPKAVSLFCEDRINIKDNKVEIL